MNKIILTILQIWYGICLFACILTMWLSCKIINLLPIKDIRTKQQYCIIIANWCFYMVFVLTPWIKINNFQKHPIWDEMRQDIKNNKGVMICLNHTSFLDAIIFAGYCPTDIIIHVRTLLKYSLTQIPLFGFVCNMCGHFPVHFKSTQTGNFSTDKDAMNKVMQKVNDHIYNSKYNKEYQPKDKSLGNGSIVFFPEGQIGKIPSSIQSLRRGSFKMALDNNMNIYTMIMVGNQDSWPRKASIGGLPATINIGLDRVQVNTEDDYIKVSESTRDVMQNLYNKLSN